MSYHDMFYHDMIYAMILYNSWCCYGVFIEIMLTRAKFSSTHIFYLTFCVSNKTIVYHLIYWLYYSVPYFILLSHMKLNYSISYVSLSPKSYYSKIYHTTSEYSIYIVYILFLVHVIEGESIGYILEAHILIHCIYQKNS